MLGKTRYFNNRTEAAAPREVAAEKILHFGTFTTREATYGYAANRWVNELTLVSDLSENF